MTDLTIDQGTDWSHGWAVTVDGSPIDATWSARAQIRDLDDELLHDFSVEVTDEGYVILAVSPAESSPWTWGTGVYDVEVVGPGGSPVFRVDKGAVTLDREVTR